MTYDYFYGADGANQYAFFRIPKLLIRGKQFHEISIDAKLLYGLMLDRLQMSIKNSWFDENNRVYIIYTIEDIMYDLNCGNQKAVKVLAELEKKAGLVKKRRRGLGKPSIIYVMNFYSGIQLVKKRTEQTKEQGDSGNIYSVDDVDSISQKYENHTSENADPITQKCEEYTSESVISTSQKVWESQCNNNNMNNTKMNKTNPIESTNNYRMLLIKNPQKQSDGLDRIAERKKYEEVLRNKLGIEYLKQNYQDKEDIVEEIFELILDTVTSKAKTIRCAGDDKPAEIVKSQFMKLNMLHIEYILYCLTSNILDIKNIKAYLLTLLYNAPFTMDSYYTTKVSYDMAHCIPQKSRAAEVL